MKRLLCERCFFHIMVTQKWKAKLGGDFFPPTCESKLAESPNGEARILNNHSPEHPFQDDDDVLPPPAGQPQMPPEVPQAEVPQAPALLPDPPAVEQASDMANNRGDDIAGDGAEDRPATPPPAPAQPAPPPLRQSTRVSRPPGEWWKAPSPRQPNFQLGGGAGRGSGGSLERFSILKQVELIHP